MHRPRQVTGTKTYWLDIVRECIVGRQAPLLPEEFAKQLRTKKFTNGNEDYELVCKLYESAFLAQFQECTRLIYHRLYWGDDEVLQLVKVIMMGALPKVSELSLEDNNITDVGAASLADAIRQGALPALTLLNISSNDRISDIGKDRLQEACNTRHVDCQIACELLSDP